MFIDAVHLMQNGVPHTIPEKPAGTQVAVTVTAESLKDSSSTADSATFRYFVGSDKPLVYHMGTPTDACVRFNSTKCAHSADRISSRRPHHRRRTPTVPSDVTALLSWEFANAGPNQRFGFLATLGTGFANPGEVFYYGQIRTEFGKLVLTGGFVTAKTSEGEGATPTHPRAE